MKKLIDFCKENDIEFVAVTTPVPIAALKDHSDNYNAAWKYFGKFFEEQGVDYIAASFVRNSDCIMDIREILEDNHGRDIGIIARSKMQKVWKILMRSWMRQTASWLHEGSRRGDPGRPGSAYPEEDYPQMQPQM